MTELDQLADELGVSGRTLRRAGVRGTIRWARSSPRVITIAAAEYEYVRRHWPLFECALEVLRTRPAVRLAVLFGSAARGDGTAASDLDLLVRMRGGWSERVETALALENALGRPVQLVDLDLAPPLLLSDVLRDGRVLADRDGDWPRLKRRSCSIAHSAAAEDVRLEHSARELLGRFDALVGS
jgi:uncharacterized protein